MPQAARKPFPWRPAMWGAAVLLVLAPALAMQLTPAMNWGPGDFAIFGGLLLGLCLTIELVVRLVRQPMLRTVLAVAAVGAFLAIWAHLAVGIW